MNAQRIDGHLWLVDLDQRLEGYRRFISCWVWRDEQVAFVVDPGPRSSAAGLLAQLAGLGIEALDFVLLTHIHLDHGGAAAEVLAAHPGARLVCHENAVPHLLEPGKLWQGSLATIGEVARAYGEPTPVPADRLATSIELADRGIQSIPTPGHAPHHLSFIRAGTLFAGEAIATRIQLADGRDYLRPATPPRFVPDVFLASMQRLAGLEPEPQRVAFAHYGWAPGVRAWCRLAADQLRLWIAQAEQHRADPAGELDGLIEQLLAVDPAFGQGRFQSLDADVQARERFYVTNSLRGILGSLQS